MELEIWSSSIPILFFHRCGLSMFGCILQYIETIMGCGHLCMPCPLTKLFFRFVACMPIFLFMRFDQPANELVQVCSRLFCRDLKMCNSSFLCAETLAMLYCRIYSKILTFNLLSNITLLRVLLSLFHWLFGPSNSLTCFILYFLLFMAFLVARVHLTQVETYTSTFFMIPVIV